MRILLRIILFPIRIVLSISILFLTFLLSIGTAILYILMMFCIFGAIASFINKAIGTGISALIIGFLASPLGLPLIGCYIIGFLTLIRDTLREI